MEVKDYERIIKGEMQRVGGGLQGAVAAKCVDCIYDPAGEGSRRKQVHECGGVDCPIYPFRALMPDTESPPAILVRSIVGNSDNWQRKDKLIRSKQEKGTLRSAVDGFCFNLSQASYPFRLPGIITSIKIRSGGSLKA